MKTLNEQTCRISFVMKTKNRDKLKHILIDEHKTLTDFIIEAVDKKIKDNKKY